MADIIATRGKETRKFSELQWKLLGKDKNGWEALNDQPISNVNDIVKPPTGNKSAQKESVSVPIDNKVGKTDDPQKVDNKVESNSGDKKNDEPSVEELKGKFLEAAKDIRPGTIKDYFDEKKQSYKKNAKASELILKLGAYLNYDVEELKKLFS